ncbi:BgTH12-01236 [Blumeria graminis f. sp. triticale]|uniref:BgTH12-01236 n=1 Tax=Blumeria graminis f. sp. triticale TaxID=1689686 RepID=A0A9W4GHK1_BLUGR|nr:BgTH12-01236 [Blumeria graminis f. sp. triticale]
MTKWRDLLPRRSPAQA